MHWAGHIAHMVKIKMYTQFYSEIEGTRPFGKLESILEDNIKMDLEEIWCEFVGWIYLACWLIFCEHDKRSSGTVKAEDFLTS
jgi:hypothetical protein